MSARALPFLTAGVVALVIAGCSGGVTGSAAPAPSSTATPPTSAAPASASATTQQPATTPRSTPAKPAGAVERYEAYLHAVGEEDVTTACEIAAPAAKKAEDEGFGPCEKTLPISFAMFSAGQRKALLSATVDRGRVTESATRVDIPAKAVQAGVKFTSSDLGDAVLELRGGKWYITD